MRYFDYSKTAREPAIPEDRLLRIVELFRAEYPHDEMLAELHVLRACMAVRDGLATLDEVLRAQALTQR